MNSLFYDTEQPIGRTVKRCQHCNWLQNINRKGTFWKHIKLPNGAGSMIFLSTKKFLYGLNIVLDFHDDSMNVNNSIICAVNTYLYLYERYGLKGQMNILLNSQFKNMREHHHIWLFAVDEEAKQNFDRVFGTHGGLSQNHEPDLRQLAVHATGPNDITYNLSTIRAYSDIVSRLRHDQSFYLFIGLKDGQRLYAELAHD